MYWEPHKDAIDRLTSYAPVYLFTSDTPNAKEKKAETRLGVVSKPESNEGEGLPPLNEYGYEFSELGTDDWEKCVIYGVYGDYFACAWGDDLKENDSFLIRGFKFRKIEPLEEKARREREENAIAYFEFETQCFREAGEDDQLLSDSWEQADSVAKETYRIMAEKLNFKTHHKEG